MRMQPEAAAGHDHGRCVARALYSADALCADSGARLTALRRRVLECIWRGHDAVKAYEIVAQLGGGDRAAKPPTVYRALQFLQEQGLVHRLESLNAFVGCRAPWRCRAGQFLICTACGEVGELHEPAIPAVVADAAERAGFAVERQTVEVLGRCARCR